MTVQFRQAVASEAKPLVGLYAESGKGKTKSALYLAKGFVEAMGGTMHDVGMIETEAGRGEAYADDREVGGFRVLPLRDSFSPRNYGAAIRAAEEAKLRALIIDSASHEWEGVGGVLAMAAENQAKEKKGPLVWQQPKIDHQREFMGRLLQTPIPLVIVCMRAKYPMYQVKPADVKRWEEAGKPGMLPKVGEWARAWELEPKQSDDILYEMFVHGWIDDQHRFHGTKYTVEPMRDVFVHKEPISAETGKRLYAWSRGRSAPVGASAKPPPAPEVARADAPQQPEQPQGDGEFITPDQVADLEALCGEHGVPVAKLRARADVRSLQQILAADYRGAVKWVKAGGPATNNANAGATSGQ